MELRTQRLWSEEEIRALLREEIRSPYVKEWLMQVASCEAFKALDFLTRTAKRVPWWRRYLGGE